MFKDILLCTAGLTAIFIIPTIIVALIWLRARRRETQTYDSWIELSNTLGLSYEPRKFLGLPVAGSLHGNYRGRGIFLDSVRETPLFGEEKRFYRLWVGIKKNQYGKLSFSRKTALDKVTSLVGGDDVKIGDTQFDERFVIKADSDDAARSIFSSAFLRQKLINGPSLSFSILEDRIESIFSQRAHESNYWRSIIDLLCDVAEAV